jgi:hypothetical protein
MGDEEVSVIGITSCQWSSFPYPFPGSAEYSAGVNDSVMRIFTGERSAVYTGLPSMITFSTNIRSRAAEFIVEQAKKHSPKKKLNIIVTGPLTNVASAVLLDSTIAPRIKVYATVMKYNSTDKVFNKNEFNTRNDLDALDVLLNRDDLEMHIMPVTGAGELLLKKSELSDLFSKGGEAGAFFVRRLNLLPGKDEISLPELSLVEAFLNPDFMKEDQIQAPPENNHRRIYVYTKRTGTIWSWITGK